MLSYLNNPNLVFPAKVPIQSSTNEIEVILVDLVKSIVNESSIQSCQYSSFTIQILTGGITNALYLVQTSIDNVLYSYIVRVFGQGTDVIIDRVTENIVFASLSKLKQIVTPTFYGLFENGRVEGYIPNSKTLSPPDLYDMQYLPLIANSISLFHTIVLNEISNDIMLWTKIDKFFEIATEASFDDPTKQDMLQCLNVLAMKLEYRKLKDYITSLRKSTRSKNFQLGYEFGKEITLCHNDLLSGNILYSIPQSNDGNNDSDSSNNSNNNNNNSIVLIDYEYCGYNYRAYDISNHFCEFCGFDFNVQENFPMDHIRMKFLEVYVTSMIENLSLIHSSSSSSSFADASRSINSLTQAIREGMVMDDVSSIERKEFLQGLDICVLEFTAASHFFWGTWSIVQSTLSQIEFDYLSYAKLRYDGYHYHKDLFQYSW